MGPGTLKAEVVAGWLLNVLAELGAVAADSGRMRGLRHDHSAQDGIAQGLAKLRAGAIHDNFALFCAADQRRL